MSKLYGDYINKLTSRFKMTKLELETDAPQDKGADLQELVNERERQEQSKYFLCTATTVHKGTPVRVWFDKSRPTKFVF